MSTITKERLQRLIRAIDSENFDEEEIVGWVNSDEIMELARIALAAMQQEPGVPTFDQWMESSGRKPLGWVKDAMRESYDACRAAMLQAGNSPVIQDGWRTDAERLAELHGSSFVIFRHGESPMCTDPTKFWFGYDPAALQQEQQRTVSTAKHLTIILPDISSKAFWSGTGKSEVFHPETYHRWVKEAIERDCTIAGIGVEVR